MPSIMTSRQAAELDYAFERNGFTPGLVKKLSKGDTLELVKEVLLGHAEIKRKLFLVDLDADPVMPEGHSLATHRKDGKFKYDPKKVRLYLSPEQLKGKTVVGNDLYMSVRDRPVMNSNMLDFYLRNQHLIDRSWNGKVVVFWGTVYRDAFGRPCVACLYWAVGEWKSRLLPLDSTMYAGYFAAEFVEQSTARNH